MRYVERSGVTTLPLSSENSEEADARLATPALVLVWSRDEPERVGEMVLPPLGAQRLQFSIGREGQPGSGILPLSFVRLRPHEMVDTGPLRSPHVSRRQLRVRAIDRTTVEVERLAGVEMRVNQVAVDRAKLQVGDVLEVARRFVLRCSQRPQNWPHSPSTTDAFDYGVSDADGMVGESPVSWGVRRMIGKLGQSDAHALILGPSGSGKELVAQAIHRQSRRAAVSMVSRNAATFPDALIDAELFGNMKNFPNPGMPLREGLFGAAEHSTLFLDELGELPNALQAHLLRVLDSGEYQRLGETKMRRADVRLIGATNQTLASLRHELAARFALQVELSGLDAHRDDIPLLAVHLLREIATTDKLVQERFFEGTWPRFSAELMITLLTHRYTTNIRELRELLWRSILASPGDKLELTDRSLKRTPEASTIDPADITQAQVVAALERCEGVRERAWRELGLRSRYQLKRLIKKYGLTER